MKAKLLLETKNNLKKRLQAVLAYSKIKTYEDFSKMKHLVQVYGNYQVSANMLMLNTLQK